MRRISADGSKLCAAVIWPTLLFPFKSLSLRPKNLNLIYICLFYNTFSGKIWVHDHLYNSLWQLIWISEIEFLTHNWLSFIDRSHVHTTLKEKVAIVDNADPKNQYHCSSFEVCQMQSDAPITKCTHYRPSEYSALSKTVKTYIIILLLNSLLLT